MTTHGPVRWCRVNLFATPLDILLSCVFLPLTFFMVWKLGAWVLLQAKWSIIADNLRVLMVGTFPVEYLGRAWYVAGCLLSPPARPWAWLPSRSASE